MHFRCPHLPDRLGAIVTLGLIHLLAFHSPAATWFVSNVGTNGYLVGSDSNEGTTTNAPFLTIAHACSVAASGDSIRVNPGGVPYQESTPGFQFLVVDRPLTIQTDPSWLGQGKAVLQPPESAEAPLELAADGLVLEDLVIDANQGTSLSRGVTLRGDVLSATLRRCDFKNFPARASFCLASTATHSQVLLDRCTATRANGVDSSVAFLAPPGNTTNLSISLLGCEVSGIYGVLLHSGLASGPFRLLCDVAPDGTRNTFSNLAYCVTWGACPDGTELTLTNCDLADIRQQAFRGSGSPAANMPSLTLAGIRVTNTPNPLVSCEDLETIGSLDITGLEYHGSAYVLYNLGTISQARITQSTIGGDCPVVYSANASLQNLSLSSCRFDSTSRVIQMSSGGGGLLVTGCQFSNTTETAIFLSGPFPNVTVTSNTLTGAYGLLDVRGICASNIFVGGNYISLTNATTDPIAVVGSTGVEICYNTIWSDAAAAHGILVGTDGYDIFDDNSGADAEASLGATSSGTWIAQRWDMAGAASCAGRGVASFSIFARKNGEPAGTITAFLYGDSAGAPGSLLATSSVSVPASALAAGSTRPLEFWFDDPYTAAYSTPYWLVLKYDGTVNGTDYVVLDGNSKAYALSTSDNGTVWNPGNHSLLYNVYHGSFECINPLVHDNFIACSTPSANLHCVILGGVSGGQVYRNQAYGGGPMLVAKLVDGSSRPCLFYDNLVFEYSGTQEGLRDKGSRGVQFLHNTVVLNGTRGVAILLDNNYFGDSYNGHPSVGAVAKNNIFYASSLPGSGIIYQLGALGYLSPTCIAPSIDYNLVFAGPGVRYFGIDDSDGMHESAYTSWSSWQAAGYDVHGINLDPRLSNPVNPSSPVDFTPAQDSPALGAGTDLLTTVSADFYGVSNNETPTVGAMQAPTAPQLDILSSAVDVQIGVNGITGQRLALEASADLLLWQSLATNTLSTNRWIYTNTASSWEFYRAVLCR